MSNAVESSGISAAIHETERGRSRSTCRTISHSAHRRDQRDNPRVSPTSSRRLQHPRHTLQGPLGSTRPEAPRWLRRTISRNSPKTDRTDAVRLAYCRVRRSRRRVPRAPDTHSQPSDSCELRVRALLGGGHAVHNVASPPASARHSFRDPTQLLQHAAPNPEPPTSPSTISAPPRAANFPPRSDTWRRRFPRHPISKKHPAPSLLWHQPNRTDSDSQRMQPRLGQSAHSGRPLHRRTRTPSVARLATGFFQQYVGSLGNGRRSSR